jgi:hypothetical protein
MIGDSRRNEQRFNDSSMTTFSTKAQALAQLSMKVINNNREKANSYLEARMNSTNNGSFIIDIAGGQRNISHIKSTTQNK